MRLLITVAKAVIMVLLVSVILRASQAINTEVKQRMGASQKQAEFEAQEFAIVERYRSRLYWSWHDHFWYANMAEQAVADGQKAQVFNFQNRAEIELQNINHFEETLNTLGLKGSEFSVWERAKAWKDAESEWAHKHPISDDNAGN